MEYTYAPLEALAHRARSDCLAGDVARGRLRGQRACARGITYVCSAHVGAYGRALADSGRRQHRAECEPNSHADRTSC